ncbi:hypothetical protein HBH61_047950 [Parastagonospora nodorum]|nr:hypothetical protein HBH50_096580 [Parastagonospora nodorum]KAH4090833.1 hypothetical protein HBH48_100350 [Parastagonospora nodorum]KAH4817458.1 hypothetical protein HBH61_047950 [Parastagonospora nodorum]KAH4919291.1 hypothetical protein HBH74_131620 [Parastagonospora nodorum]KAH4926415.1 hypothetical protein HBI79_143190 [Parastagonospora nodorum]
MQEPSELDQRSLLANDLRRDRCYDLIMVLKWKRHDLVCRRRDCCRRVGCFVEVVRARVALSYQPLKNAIVMEEQMKGVEAF